MAVWTALGNAASQQVLFRSGAVLERLAAVDTVCFDKTGTLTTGDAEVSEVLVAADVDRREMLCRAARLASGSTHSLSRAIGAFAASENGDDASSQWRDVSLRTLAGRGVAAVDGGGVAVALLGSARWMAEENQSVPDDLAHRITECMAGDASMTFVAWGGQVRGVFYFREQLRPEARTAVAACRAMGLAALMLTGDHRERAAALAQELGLGAVGEQLPQDKAAMVQWLGGRVAMVGDGINDAPALAGAEVGVALGCGADLSRDAAGVCLLGDELQRLPWAIDLARQTMRIVRQNLFWAFAYNTAGIALAATGRLNPIWAAAAMGASSILVIGNSLRLARYGLAAPEREPVAVAPAMPAPLHDSAQERGSVDAETDRRARPAALAGACL